MKVRRKKHGYFKRIKDGHEPLSIQIKRRVGFHEADVLGIAWYGRYAEYFGEGAAELGRHCGLSYDDFRKAKLRAPIVQFHVDYYQSLVLDEEFIIKTSLIWSEGARLNTEYMLTKQDGTITTAGYTVQMFIDGITGEICIASPDILEQCRREWKAGAFACLQ